jgi:hypothetical protein
LLWLAQFLPCSLHIPHMYPSSTRTGVMDLDRFKTCEHHAILEANMRPQRNDVGLICKRV